MDLVGVAAGGLVGAVFSTLVSTFYQYRFARRAELLDADSELFRSLFEMRQALQKSEASRELGFIKQFENMEKNDEAESAADNRWKAAYWKLKLVEPNPKLRKGVDHLFTGMSGTNTSKLDSEIEALVAQVTKLHGFTSMKWLTKLRRGLGPFAAADRHGIGARE